MSENSAIGGICQGAGGDTGMMWRDSMAGGPDMLRKLTSVSERFDFGRRFMMNTGIWSRYTKNFQLTKAIGE